MPLVLNPSSQLWASICIFSYHLNCLVCYVNFMNIVLLSCSLFLSSYVEDICISSDLAVCHSALVFYPSLPDSTGQRKGTLDSQTHSSPPILSTLQIKDV